MAYALEDIGQTLKTARERRGLSQRAFANAAGTDQARISKIENGEIDLRLSSLVDLARTLGLELILAERRHVPAIEAMIADGASGVDPKRKGRLLKRIEERLQRLLDTHPDNHLLQQASNALPFLSMAGLSESELSLLKETNEVLISVRRKNIDELTPKLRALIQLRNEKAHGAPEAQSEQRPAYNLEDDDE